MNEGSIWCVSSMAEGFQIRDAIASPKWRPFVLLHLWDFDVALAGRQPGAADYVSCEAGRDRLMAGNEFQSRRIGVWKRDIIPI